MLEIINNLRPFFEDCYRRISVREYSRLVKISPPTASKKLSEFGKEEILLAEKDRNYIFYYANKENKVFIEFSRIYWQIKLKNLVDFLSKSTASQGIILFGSLSKAEAKSDSDVDICILGHKKEINLKPFEENLKRKIQLFFFSSIESVPKELANNIINGLVIEGRMKL